MGRLRDLALFMGVFFFFTNSAIAATCNYEEKAKLNNEVANIKVNYEILQRELDPEIYGPPDDYYKNHGEEWEPTTDYFQINILNLTENFYVEVRNNNTRDTSVYNYSDTENGKLKVIYENISEVTKFTITIKASSGSSCVDQKFKTLYLTLPRYNDYSTYGVCNKLSDYYMCQRYVTFDTIDFDYFVDKTVKELEKRESQEISELKWYEKVWEFIVDHKTIFITGGVIVIAGGAVTTVVIIRKRRRSII